MEPPSTTQAISLWSSGSKSGVSQSCGRCKFHLRGPVLQHEIEIAVEQVVRPVAIAEFEDVVSRFQQLFSIAIFAEWLFYMIAASTIFIFRRRLPNAARAYRAWGYPVVPAIFIAAAALLLYSTFAENLKRSFVGSAVILAGIPVFLYFNSKLKHQKIESLQQ